VVINVLPEIASLFKDDGWCMPPTGAAAEYESLMVHHRDVKHVDGSFSTEALERVCGFYPRTHHFNFEDVPVWNRVLECVKRQSSPGYPYAIRWATNGAILDDVWATKFVVERAVSRLRRLGQLQPEQLLNNLKRDPVWAVREGFCDVSRVFIKYQAHPLRKLTARKFRIINSLGIVDLLVQLFLFSAQDDAEINQWDVLPSKPGFGLANDVDCESLAAFVEQHKLNISDDVSAWDASMPFVALLAEAEMRILLAIDPAEWWCSAVRNVYIMSAYRVMMCSDTSCYVRVVPGSMPSGAKFTASSNSRIRFLFNAEFNARKGKQGMAMTMGDDAVERVDAADLEEYRQFLKSFGVTLTDVETTDSKRFSFCSHDIVNGKPIPCSPNRMIVNYLNEPTDEAYCSLIMNMRHSPELRQVIEVIRAKGLGPEKHSD